MNTPPNPSEQLVRSLKRAGLMVLMMIVMAAALMGYIYYRFQQELQMDGPSVVPAAPPMGHHLEIRPGNF